MMHKRPSMIGGIRPFITHAKEEDKRQIDVDGFADMDITRMENVNY